MGRMDFSITSMLIAGARVCKNGQFENDHKAKVIRQFLLTDMAKHVVIR